MGDDTDNNATAHLENEIGALLRNHPRGLTARRIRDKLRHRPPTFQVEDALHRLKRQGRLEVTTGDRWRVVGASPAGRFRPRETVPTTKASNGEQHPTPDREVRAAPIVRPGMARWADFRRLCGYYAECLRIEASRQVGTYADREGERFVALANINVDCAAAGERMAFRIEQDWAKLIRYLTQHGAEASLFLGGPVWVHAGQDAQTKESYQRLFPVFVMPVRWERRGDLLHLHTTDRWEVNHGWLERRFKRVDERRAFLELVGLSEGGSDDFDELDDDEFDRLPATDAPTLATLYNALHRYHRDWWKEYGDPHKPTTKPSLSDVETSGLYNRMVLVAQPKLKYTWRLVRELKKLARRVPDEDLDRSALAHLFPHTAPSTPGADGSSDKANADPAVVQAGALADDWSDQPAEVEPLNPEQRVACQLAMVEPVSIVKGPPGTGKSRVVGQVMADAAMRGRSTLFASRNHQAIAAVVPRLNAMTEPNPLVLNLAQRFGEGGAGGTTLLRSVNDMLGQPKPDDITTQRDASRQRLLRRLDEVRQLQQQLDEVAEASGQLDEALSDLQLALRKLPGQDEGTVWQLAGDGQIRRLPSESSMQAEIARLQRWHRPWPVWGRMLQPLRSWWFRRRIWPATASMLDAYEQAFSRTVSRSAIPSPTEGAAQLEQWLPAARALSAAERVVEHRQQLQRHPSWNECLQRISAEREPATAAARHQLELTARALGAGASGEDNQALAEIRAELEQAPSPLAPKDERRLEKLLRERLGVLLEHLPLWSTVNLSAGRDLPLAPALFDLLIIDEASQCDIASVIPLLFRARRAMIVGDPMQLPHIVSLPKDMHHRLRERFDLTDARFSRFMHLGNSCFDLASSDARTRAQTQLRDHHRSHAAIAEYSNKAFYREQLNVLTEPGHLRALPAGRKRRMGLAWTDLADDTEAMPGGGAISRGQIQAIVAELKRLEEEGYRGTVGVVTPFRKQANRLRDAAMAAFNSTMPEAWAFRVDTADGFQGGERDVMMFSLVGGQNMPRGSHQFLVNQPNRFNVAVSRARTLLHVFANRTWAAGCGIRHIEQLVEAYDRQESVASGEEADYRSDLVGPVWEPRFVAALREAGLPVQQQYPALGRFYLDIAMLREDFKLAVEVDGEAWHRDASGNQKADDVRRDLALVGAGWRVLRFWVYELREDMAGCVEQVKQAWGNATDHAPHKPGRETS